MSQRERKGLDLRGATLRCVSLSNLPLAGVQGGQHESEEENATLLQMREAAATFGRSHLNSIHLEGASLSGTTLWRADLSGAHLFKTHLQYANLHRAFFDETSTLKEATFGSAKHKFAQIADVRWGSVNLAGVNRSQAKRTHPFILGDEQYARQQETMNSTMKDEA